MAPSGEWVTEANGRRCSERCTLPPTSLSAPSCKAGVYARCRLKTIGTRVEHLLPELWAVREPTSQWLLCHCLFVVQFYLSCEACCYLIRIDVDVERCSGVGEACCGCCYS